MAKNKIQAHTATSTAARKCKNAIKLSVFIFASLREPPTHALKDARRGFLLHGSLEERSRKR